MANYTYEELERMNPYRLPSWRFKRIQELLDRGDSGNSLSTIRDDRYVRVARKFILKYRNAESQEQLNILRLQDPGLFYAIKIYERGIEDPSLPFIIEARILARQSDEVIAKSVATCEETIAWYERLIFNVRDRLDNRDYISRTVIVPAYCRAAVAHASDSRSQLKEDQVTTLFPKQDRSVANVDVWYDGTIKFFAYMAGEYALEPLLNNCDLSGMPQSPAHASTWFEDYWMQAFRRKNAQAIARFGVNRYNVSMLFATNALLISKSQAMGGQADPEIEGEMQAIATACGKSFLQGAHASGGSKMDLAELTAKGVEPRVMDQLAAGGGREIRPSGDILTVMPPPTRRGKITNPMTDKAGQQ